MWMFRRAGSSGFSGSSTAEQVTQGIDGTGLTAIVTGASNGIVIETARALALRGVHVVMGVRNVNAGNKVKEQILAEAPNAVIDVMEIDLNSLASVRKFASEYHSSGLPLNILINNAGIMSVPFALSKDNIEQQCAVNHLAPFHLTNLLLELMKKTASESNKEGRIVNLSSMLHNNGYKQGIRFDKINDESRVYMKYCSYFIKSVPQGAATTCYVALHPQVKGISGVYFDNCNIANPIAMAKDEELAKKLWDF